VYLGADRLDHWACPRIDEGADPTLGTPADPRARIGMGSTELISLRGVGVEFGLTYRRFGGHAFGGHHHVQREDEGWPVRLKKRIT